jgi:hypothetical protein
MAAPYIDPLMALQRSLDAYVAHSVPILAPDAIFFGGVVAVFMGMATFLRAGADLAIGKEPEHVIVDVLTYFAHVWIVGIELALYIPLTNLITATGSFLANQVAANNLDLVLQNIAECITKLQHPVALDFFNLILYYAVLLLMTAMDVVLFLVTSPAYLFTGLGLIVGQILIPLQLLPWFKGKFWNWLNFILMFAIGYRLVASCWTAIFGGLLLYFFQNMIAHNYGLGHMLALFAAQVTIVTGTIVLAFAVPYIAHELFGHSGSAGGGFGSSFRGAATVLLFR